MRKSLIPLLLCQGDVYVSGISLHRKRFFRVFKNTPQLPGRRCNVQFDFFIHYFKMLLVLLSSCTIAMVLLFSKAGEWRDTTMVLNLGLHDSRVEFLNHATLLALTANLSMLYPIPPGSLFATIYCLSCTHWRYHMLLKSRGQCKKAVKELGNYE